MALSTPRSMFGIHSVSPYSRDDGTFYGIIKVLDNSSISLAAEQVDLYGGSNKYPWASEDGQISAEMSLKIGQMDDFIFELFLGKAPTQNSAEASGNVSALVEVNGNLVDGTGLASVAALAGSSANLKFGKYIVKATSTTAIAVYLASDIDLARGTDVEYVGDDLEVASGTVTSGANLDFTSLGLRFVGGAGTIGMTAGDTASFEVRPVNSKSSTVVIGAAADVFPEFGAIIMAQARSNGELFEIDAYRCKASGMPIGFESFTWNKPEVKAKLLYDAAKNGVFEMRHVTP